MNFVGWNKIKWLNLYKLNNSKLDCNAIKVLVQFVSRRLSADQGLGCAAGGRAASRQKPSRCSSSSPHAACRRIKGLGYETGGHVSLRQKTASRSANLILRGKNSNNAASLLVCANIFRKIGSLKWPTKQIPPAEVAGGICLVGHQGLEPWTNRL